MLGAPAEVRQKFSSTFTHSAQIHELIGATHRMQPAFAATRAGAVRTSVVVTHDTELLRRLKPRIVMLHKGLVHFDGTFEQFTQSDDEHVRPYLAQMPGIHLDPLRG